jgi:membrane protein
MPGMQGQLLEPSDDLLSDLVREQALVWRTRTDLWLEDIAQLKSISVLCLFVSLMFLVNRVDHALHWVLQVDRRRGKRRWLHYLWVMPALLVVLIVSMTLIVVLQILLGTGLLALLPGVNLTSIPVMWLLFCSVYQLSSRGTVSLKNSILVSVLVTVSFIILKTIFAWLYLSLPNWSIVFGVFSAVPLFLLWCQMAWCIFLYGGLILRWLSYKVSLAE